MLPQASFEAVLEHLHDAVYVLDRDRKITYWNRAAERLTGYSRESVLGRSCSDNILVHVDGDGNSLCKAGCPMVATMQDQQLREAVVYMRHHDGHRLPVAVRTAPLLDEHGKVVGAVETFTDGTHEVETQQRVKELERQAMFDALTELPNRRYLEFRIDTLSDELARYGWQYGLLLLDVDHFKAVNDTYGHDIGDEVLRMVGRTVRGNARRSDVIGRWGGEEFLGILAQVDMETLRMVAERLRVLIASSQITVEGKPLGVTVSVGAASVRPGERKDQVIKRVDELLYEAKQTGRNRVCLAE